ncbi:MAG: 50S ribosomal protein L1 [Candidatus Levybacteria bacterium]|nr:50S ribosomal protein L1 [Candidatus Levybacteria bacterium]
MVKKQKGGVQKKTRSEKYKAASKLVDKTKTYTLKEALELLPKLKVASFDETVELHINTTETGLSGTISLPHGTGKQVRVVIADDGVIEKIQSGKIDFDILVSTPQMMPKLARVAKVLGPKGLMPNPKNGTVTDKPEEVAKKFAGGQMRYKTEAKNPIMHVMVGKVSFGASKLSENISTMLSAVGVGKMKKVTLKSTMSPAIQLDFSAVK